jgi:photosystem II 22kDa protein
MVTMTMRSTMRANAFTRARDVAPRARTRTRARATVAVVRRVVVTSREDGTRGVRRAVQTPRAGPRANARTVTCRVTFDPDADTEASPEAFELNLGRLAMLGFFSATLGDVLTRGDGPIEQLAREESFIARHVNPIELARDALEVAGFYVESVVLIWALLGGVLLLGVSQGLRNPIKTVSGKSAKQRAEVVKNEIVKAYEVNVREQKPYELFNGRLAMLGTTFAFIGDVETGGLGPLEQVNSELGIPVLDEEIFAVVFLLGVTFNVVSTGVTAVRRAYAKGRE